MAVFDLADQGEISLTDGTERIFLTVTSLPTNHGEGRANPPNLYDVGLLRFGCLGAYGRAFPIDAESMFFDVPSGGDTLAYSMFDGALATASESTPVIVGWELVASGHFDATVLFSDYVSDEIFLPAGYARTRFVLTDTGAGSNTAKLCQGNADFVNLSGDQTPPVDVIVEGAIDGDSVKVHYSVSAVDSADWFVYATSESAFMLMPSRPGNPHTPVLTNGAKVGPAKT
jgi:hypothetical protein